MASGSMPRSASMRLASVGWVDRKSDLRPPDCLSIFCQNSMAACGSYPALAMSSSPMWSASYSISRLLGSMTAMFMAPA